MASMTNQWGLPTITQSGLPASYEERFPAEIQAADQNWFSRLVKSGANTNPNPQNLPAYGGNVSVRPPQGPDIGAFLTAPFTPPPGSKTGLENVTGIVDPRAAGMATFLKNVAKPQEPQPISVVRGLNTSEYLPTMNERGQVQYIAKKTPAEELAQAKEIAGLQKTQSEAVKNLRVPAVDQATLMRLADAKKLQALATTTQDPNERKQSQAAYEEIIKSLLVKPGMLEAMLASTVNRTE